MSVSIKWFDFAFGFGWPGIAEKQVRNYLSFLKKIMLGKSITMTSPGAFSIFVQLGSPCLLHIDIRSWCFCIIILPMFQNGCFIQNCNVWCVYLSNKIRVIELSGRHFRLLKQIQEKEQLFTHQIHCISNSFSIIPYPYA